MLVVIRVNLKFKIHEKTETEKDRAGIEGSQHLNLMSNEMSDLVTHFIGESNPKKFSKPCFLNENSGLTRLY